MSLESQVAALVSAASNLTSQVAGKLSEIDTALQSAVASIPQEIRNQMELNVYVDQANGSDSNSGLSESDPLKSMTKVASLTPSGGSVDIRVMGNYTFADLERANFTNAQVRVRSWPSNTRAKIKSSGVVDANNHYHCNNFYAFRNCAFQFFGVDLELPDIPAGINGSTIASQNSSVIGSNSAGDVAAPLSIRLASVNIEVPEPASNPFSITPGFGIVIISTANVTVPAEWVDNFGLLHAMSSDPALYTHTRVIHDSKALIPTSLT